MQYVQHLATKGAAPYMTTLFYFQEKFPQYKWNPNHPLGNVHLTGGGFVKNLEYLKDDFNHEWITQLHAGIGKCLNCV
jgi:phosphoribosylaminoimidazole (AIR) synthetase